MREAGVEFDWLTGSDLTEAHWDTFFAFYMDTGGRKWGHPYLTREFFSRVGASMADQILLVMARRDGRYIAGALNFFGDGVLFGRNWGCTEFVPFLHFETCYYQAIDFAIARRLAQGRGRRAGRAQTAARLPADADLQRALHRACGPAPRGRRLSRARTRSRRRAHRRTGRARTVPERP